MQTFNAYLYVFWRVNSKENAETETRKLITLLGLDPVIKIEQGYDKSRRLFHSTIYFSLQSESGATAVLDILCRLENISPHWSIITPDVDGNVLLNFQGVCAKPQSSIRIETVEWAQFEIGAYSFYSQ